MNRRTISDSTLPLPRESLAPPSRSNADAAPTLVPCPSCARCDACEGTGLGRCPRCEHRTVACSACAACLFCHGVRMLTAELAAAARAFIEETP